MAASDKATDETPASPLDGSASSESAETFQYAARTSQLRTLDQVCAEHVREALEVYRWNMSQAAPALGVDRRTLYRMCERWGIARPERHKNARAEPASLIPSEAEQEAFDGLAEVAARIDRAIADGVIAPGPGLGDLIREFGPDDAETTRRVLGVDVGEQPGQVVYAGGFQHPADVIPVRGIPDLPGLRALPASQPPPEFEDFGHIPTLEIDE